MKRLLIVLVLLVLSIFLGLKLLEGAAERVVESQASRALGAEVAIGRLQLHPLAAAITLHDLQVTEPAGATLQAGSLRANFDPEQLVSRRVVVERARLRDARLTLPQRSAAQAELPDPTRLATESAARLKGELRQILQALTAIDQRWQPRRAAIASADPRQLQVWEGELRQDLAQIQQLISRARALPEQELNRQLAALGVDSQQGGITQVLLAPTLAPLLARLSQWQLPAGDGDGWPVLVRSLMFRGELGDGVLSLFGEIRDATTHPGLWPQPLAFDLRGDRGEGLVVISGDFDQGTAAGDVRLHIERLPVAALPLIHSEPLTATIGQALVDGGGHLDLAPDRLDGSAHLSFTQATLSIAADAGSPLAQRAAQLLDGVDAFDLQLQLGGTRAAPTVTLTSSLDQQLASLLQQDAGLPASELRADLERQLAPEREGIQALVESFNALQQAFEQRRGRLR